MADETEREHKSDGRYHPADIEAKWQARWEAERLFARKDPGGDSKQYVIEMFAYPSGDLHWGHVRNYTIGDVFARYQTARGKNVFHPFGFDAFGLPAENAAIKRNVHPAEWTHANIAHMTSQLKRMGYSYDWDHTLNTCDPEYYRWNQCLFLKFHERGLAYKKKSLLNWCPQDKTVLANEQVLNGCCERCGTPVVKRELSQWFFRITDYADRLLENHAQLDWPQAVIEMQKNWIGRSTGALIDFDLEAPFAGESLSVFTTRPDTLFGVTYMVLAPEHPLVARVKEAFPAEAERIGAFVEKVGRESEIDRTAEDKPKEGVPLPIFAINPANGDRIPVWIANYVLVEYGTGAVMAVPAHDERDFAFAKQHALPIVEVIAPSADSHPSSALDAAYTDPGVMVNSAEFTGLSNADGKGKVVAGLEGKGKGKATVNFRLRDWCISRQRYWGTPIPMVYCDSCGIVPLPYSALPVTLPTDVAFTGQENPLQTSPSFLMTSCPTCGGPARRETDTMDTFVDSSWYFLRYLNPRNETVPFDSSDVKEWMPLDMYIGGREHATMHLIYARFFTMALHDMGLVDFDEPFTRLFNQGILTQGGSKMSKRGNATPPNQLLDKYGADACRMFILFVAPPEERTEWNEAGVEGTFRFLTRVWRFVTQPKPSGSAFLDSDEPVRRALHRTIQKVTEDMDGLRYNTAIAAMMELMNALSTASLSGAAWSEAATALVQMLNPLAPHFACEAWQMMGHRETLYANAWPAFDADLGRENEVEIVLQINGKVRDHLTVAAGTPAADLEAMARSSEKVLAALDGKQIRKIIAVPDKLVNVVIG
ncbi:MAG TPA: leucine--tRNA ligase [Armatimonadota bacterium]|jgi:leucyl-tRNA synthetase